LFASRMKHLLAISTLSTVLLGATGAAAAANDGTLDPTFGNGGLARTYFPTGGAGAGDVVELPGGDLVAAGWRVTGISFSPSFSINIGFQLVKYGADGVLDSGFGTGGTVLTEFGDGNDQATALARQADGKLVAAGWAATDSASSDIEFAIARYLPDGSLDTSFGVGGKVTTNLTPAADEIQDLEIDSAGRIVVAGFAGLGGFGGGVGDFALARYKPDGSPDPSFGANGVTTIDFGGSLSSEDLGYGLALQPDGKIVVVGTAGRQTGGSFYQRGFGVARLNEDGSLDSSFGVGGRILTLFGFQNAEALGVALAADGKIVVAGADGSGAPRFGSGRDFAIARYLPGGTLDPAFGTGGTTTVDFFGGGDEATGVAVQPDGKIVAGGSAQTSSGDDFAAVRLTSAGSLDASFGSGGRANAFTGGGSSTAEALVLQTDGMIVLAGRAAGEGFGLARLIGAQADVTPPTLSVPAGVAVDASGPGGAGVVYSVTAHDDVDPNPVVTCAPASGTTFAIGDTTVKCTATDAAGNIASAAFVVHVRGAAEQLANLQAALAGVGPGTSLADKVALVQASLAAGDVASTCSGLAAFSNQVQAQSGRTIVGSTATALIAVAARISAVLSC